MYKISLKDIGLKVHLGVYDFERVIAQKVNVDIGLNFLNIPKGCISDESKDVICYSLINDSLQRTVTNNYYHLIEHLGFSLIKTVKSILTIPADLCLSVHKNSPLDNMKLATFTIKIKW